MQAVVFTYASKLLSCMGDNIVLEKSKTFAQEIIKVYKLLIKQNEFILSKQLLRSGTSIGANIEESVGAYSTKEFPVKLSIAYKEAREAKYWLELVRNEYTIPNCEEMINLCEEIIKLLGKSISTTRKRYQITSKH
jgi:four helix bundle protein